MRRLARRHPTPSPLTGPLEWPVDHPVTGRRGPDRRVAGTAWRRVIADLTRAILIDMSVRALFPILSTRDLPRLVEFYERAFGAKVVYRFPGDDGDAYVSLAIGPASLGIGHDSEMAEPVATGDRAALWFYVDDVDASVAAARSAGAAEVSPPADMPWGERVAQIRDPDGHLLNLGRSPDGQG